MTTDKSMNKVRMTPTWETIESEGKIWFEYEANAELYVTVTINRSGFVASVFHGQLEVEFDSPITSCLREAQEMGIAMLEQYLMDIAAEAMRMAGVE